MVMNWLDGNPLIGSTESFHNLPVLLFGEGAAGFRRNNASRRCTQKSFCEGHIVRCSMTAIMSWLPVTIWKSFILTWAASKPLPALSSREGLFQVLKSLRGPFEHCDVGGHRDLYIGKV